jgi:hypothetical protein
MSGNDGEWIVSKLSDLALRGFSMELLEKQLRIDGVEVTQGIQYYHANKHLTDPVDRSPDNSARLVANKPAWVRVYVRGAISALTGIGGVIEVQRLVLGVYKTFDTLSPESPGTVTAEVSRTYAAERNSINSTLNFIIPADDMIGSLRLKIKVAGGTLSDRTLVYLDVTLRQTLRLAGIMVGYNGPNGAPVAAGSAPVNIILAAPSLTDMQTTAAWTLTIYPVQSTATYRSAGSIVLTTPLNDPLPITNPGGCTPNWNDFVFKNLAKARTNDGNRTDVIYFGLMANGIPIGAVAGCGGPGSVAAGFNGDERAMAHEIGHVLGLKHAPCGTSGDKVDPNYPAYEPYEIPTAKTASIGEYGLDINSGNVNTPTTFKDFMSYCGPGWISLYHHILLINNSSLDPIVVSGVGKLEDDPAFADPYIISHRYIPIPPRGPFGKELEPNLEPLISIIGMVRSAKEIEVTSVARLDACRYIPYAEVTEYFAELIDKNDGLLASTPLQRLPSFGNCGCPCVGKAEANSPPYHFQAFLTNVASGTKLRIRRDNDEIWLHHAPTTTPIIQQFSAHVSKTNLLSIRWNVKPNTEQDLETWLQWSANKGNSWHCLSVGLAGKRAEIDISTLPSGLILLRLLAHDGFYTAISKSVPIKVHPHPPSAAILNPRDGTTIIAGRRFRLWGVATDTSGASLNPESTRWLIDGKELAHRLDVFATAPSEGQHRCTLIVDFNGKHIEQTHKFKTVTMPHEDEQTE